MENKKLSLNIINSIYNAKEADELLKKLLSDKINFLKVKIFTLQERYGVESPILVNRIEYLKSKKRKLTRFLEDINSDEFNVKIQCPIHLELTKQQALPNINLITSN